MIIKYFDEENMWDNLDISPESIMEFTEYCKSLDFGFLEADAESLDYSKFTKESKKYISDSSFGRIMEDIGHYSKKIVRVIQDKGLNKTSMKEIDVLMYKAFEDMAKDLDFNDSYMLKFSGYDANKIAKSVKLTCYCLFVNTLLDMILSILLGSFIGSYLTAVIVAPVVEETAKRISVQGGYTTEFAIVFNTFEFSMYVSRYAQAKNIVAIRLVAVGMHLTNFIINWISNNTKLLARLGWDKNKNKEEIANTGYITGIIIHFLWNSGFGSLVISILGLA